MSSSPADKRPCVVIVGGGFAGIEAARALADAPVELILVDRRNHHLFQPLLYQVATAALAAPDVAAPIRRILRRQRNTTVLLAEAVRIEPERRKLILEDGEISYDYLLVATGSTHAYFGHDEWARFAPGLKTIEDALEIRRRILCAFEAAERERDPAVQREWLRFVVIGAGPTGVELAGALREIAQKTLARDFRNFDPRTTEVVLLDAADRVLPPFPEDLSREARGLLEARGVEILTSAKVTGVDETGVTYDGGRITARTVLWAAGVRASPLAGTLGVPLDRAGRVLVEPDLSVPGWPEIFVAGDLAAVAYEAGWVPGMAPGAIQEGVHVAANIRRTLAGESRLPFRYRDKGSLATIGRSAAVAAIGRFHFAGFFAWLLWLFVHILYLVGFRNRVVVLFEWGFAYLTYQRSARIILERTDAEPPTQEAARPA